MVSFWKRNALLYATGEGMEDVPGAPDLSVHMA